MANKLLAERGAQPVGILWPKNFVKRTERLTTRFSRPYDQQRAQCENPAVIGDWFTTYCRAAYLGVSNTYQRARAGRSVNSST